MLWGCVASAGTGTVVKLEVRMDSIHISRFSGVMSRSPSQSWSCAGNGCFNKIMTPHIAQYLLWHLCRGTSTMFSNGFPSPQIWTSSKICGMIWSGLSMLGTLQTSMKYRGFARSNSQSTIIQDPDTHWWLQKAYTGCYFCKRRLWYDFSMRVSKFMHRPIFVLVHIAHFLLTQ